MDEKKSRENNEIQTSDGIFKTPEKERNIAPDMILSAVTNKHRRAILRALDNASNKTLPLDAVVVSVADRLNDVDSDRTDHRHRIQIALDHHHLPKLEEAQLITYESETGQVQFVGGEIEQKILSLIKPYDTSG